MKPLLLIVVLVMLAGCGTMSNSRRIVEAQTPGTASGAGASLTGPGNSSAPTTQTAQRRVGYYAPPVRDIALPTYGSTRPAAMPNAQPVAEAPAQPAAPQPAWIDETVTTTIGQHQDAAAILKVATSVGSWGRARWFGILLMLAAVGGLLYAAGNAEGYPVICWKVGGIGVFLAMFDPSPWWLLLLLIPAGFYLAQKLGLLRLPLP